MTAKVWENVGFAAGGFGVAILLLWAGAFGSGSFDHETGTLVVGVVLAAVGVLLLVVAARRRRVEH